MDGPDRRRDAAASSARLRLQLNEAQRLTLNELERFGWELKFIRRPLFQEPIPVVFDGNRKAFVALQADGTLDERPVFDIRH